MDTLNLSQIGVRFSAQVSNGMDLRGFGFPISRDSGNVARSRLKAARRKFAAPQTVIVSERRSREPNDLDRRSPLCSPLPASFSHRPHPPNTFVDNKGPTPIRPSGDRAVEALFLRFSAVESGPISAFFFRFYCSVGRGSQCFHQVPNTKNPVPAFWPTANCQLLTAIFSKSFLEPSHPGALPEYSRFI